MAILRVPLNLGWQAFRRGPRLHRPRRVEIGGQLAGICATKVALGAGPHETSWQAVCEGFFVSRVRGGGDDVRDLWLRRSRSWLAYDVCAYYLPREAGNTQREGSAGRAVRARARGSARYLPAGQHPGVAGRYLRPDSRCLSGTGPPHRRVQPDGHLADTPVGNPDSDRVVRSL